MIEAQRSALVVRVAGATVGLEWTVHLAVLVRPTERAAAVAAVVRAVVRAGMVGAVVVDIAIRGRGRLWWWRRG